MKKLLALILTVAVMLSLTACFHDISSWFGIGDDDTNEETQEAKKETEPAETEPAETEPEETEPEETEPEETEPEETEPLETEPAEPEGPFVSEFVMENDDQVIGAKITYTDNIVTQMEYSIDLNIPKEMKGMEQMFVNMFTSTLDAVIRFDFCKLESEILDGVARITLTISDLEDPDNLEDLESITSLDILKSYGIAFEISDRIYYDELEDGLLDNGFELK